MNEYDAKQEINFLSMKINQWNREYFEEHNPTVSDRHYDETLFRLAKLEEEFPQFKWWDSPTTRPGSDLSKGFPKEIHAFPMLSIQNALNVDELKRWLKKTSPYYGSEYGFSVETKIDGIALSLVYRNGRLQRAVTRGDGIEGDVVTANALEVRGVPSFIHVMDGFLEIRGEVVMSNETFKKYETEYKNPRNLVAGTMKLHDPKKVKERNLEFFAYEIFGCYNESYWEDRKLLQDKGFNFALATLCHKDEVVRRCEVYEAGRSTHPYPIDGVVVKLDNYEDRKKLGKTSKFHHWQIAYKFGQEAARSVILSIDEQVGRTGVITPVANIRPVEILGTTVKRATLHNYGQIEKLGICIGDRVLVEKGGDIIPKIVGVEKDPDRLSVIPIIPPRECPSCGGALVVDGALLRCFSSSCPAQLSGMIEHFVSKKCMNIKGLGPKTIEVLSENELVKEPADLFELEFEDLVDVGFGEVESENIIDSIYESRKVELWRFIHSLGIPLIGERASKDLSDWFGDIDTMACCWEDLNSGEVPGIGQQSVDSFRNWMALNHSIFNNLLYHIKTYVKLGGEVDPRFKDKTVVITGRFGISRDEIKPLLENIGLKVSSSISKNTNYLLCGEKPGSKLRKAEQFGTEIVDLNYFGIE